MVYRPILIERDVETPMHDGTILRADIVRPQTEEALPVLLQRTPYGKTMGLGPFAVIAAERGYAVVVQDTRGRWASDGDGTPFIHEKADGYDTVQWAAEQPWSNGKVGMFGGSYVGYTQLAAAATQPPALKAIAPLVTFFDAYDWVYPGGALALGVIVSWGLTAQAQMGLMKLDEEEEKARLMDNLIDAIDGMTTGETFRHRPLASMGFIGRDSIVPFLGMMLDHPTRNDPFWQQLRVDPASIEVPAFVIGGWYDIFAGHSTRDFAALQQTGTMNHRLWMGPWLHGPLSGLVGEVDFGFRAYDASVLLDEQQLRWFDHWLKDEDNGVTHTPPVRIFVMGDNQWREEPSWPLERAQPTPYYLHSGGGANSLNGDGALTPVKPEEEPLDTYVYDPRNPVPTRGGGLCCWSSALPAGAYDQRDIEARPDVLVYTSPALEEDLEITGPVMVHLWATTNAPDTDFTAKLVDVGPCGFARNVTDGIIRARYRRSTAQATPVTPHAVLHYEIEVGPTSNVFKTGHRIRLEISSSNFPRFARNPNTGAPIGEGADLRVAVQTVMHDAQYPSHVILPVVAEKAPA